ncbi:soluble lamin-associated protein of 75 kDa [Gracilinanus agilis]|uniref:soluble lamin-associated protein of 75 kDa n=1 Tax=Gracilinanus agilis TaxID=191870 RepID=UPI001CFDB7C3|nr:soluble lamin-associated protein of 75 kDa [Gracilinanus agilis]
MAFPVDLLNNCSHEELESSAEEYLTELRSGDPENPEYFTCLNNQIPISLSTVGFIPLYGGDQTHKILALFAPEDSLTAVALYLADHWWAVDDIVKTSVPSREGLQQVSSLGERVVLYVLNRIIYRKREMERNEVPFLCHSSTDYAKILWKKGEAIGFYSVKPTGSRCASYLTQSYQLPVLDTMYIRKNHRGKDLGLLMLEDFVDSFTEDTLGLRFPLSSFMYTACKQYFEKYPGDHDLLWEIEGTGHWHQRIPITSALQRETFRHAEVPQSEVRKLTYEDCDSISASENETGCGENKPSEMQVDPVRGRGVLDTYASTSEGLDKTPVNIQIRSSLLKRPKIGKRFHDSDINPLQDVDENTPQASSVASTNSAWTEDVIDSKEGKDKSSHDEKESPEEKSIPAPRKKPSLEDSDSVAIIPKEEPSDNGLSNSVTGEASEESVSENVSPKTTSSLEDQGEETVPDSQENSTTLSQSSPIGVELEDIQNTGQKNQSEEQSEASSEPLDHFPQSTEKAADSSSEEVEVEVPVIDRRNLRRKAKGYKGPAKKKAKLA